jgi:hypothetical protein
MKTTNSTFGLSEDRQAAKQVEELLLTLPNEICELPNDEMEDKELMKLIWQDEGRCLPVCSAIVGQAFD